MNIIKKLITIIKAKTRKNEFEGEWHKERYKICLKCEFNSVNSNKPKGLRWLFFYIANFKNTFCTFCGCSIKDKTSVEMEECPIKKWKRIEI